VTSRGGSLAVSTGDSGPQSGLVWSLRFGLELAAAGHVKRPILPPIYLEIYSSLASAIICQTYSTNATAEKARKNV